MRSAFLVLALVACHDASVSREPAAVAASSAPSPQDAARDAGAPPRCAFVEGKGEHAATLGDHLELGEATKVGDAFVVGALRVTDGGRVAAVVRTDGPPVDLGPSWGDAPPPQPFAVGTDVYAVAYVDPHPHASPAARHAPSAARRALSLYRVSPLEKLVELPSEGDPSAEYDVAAGGSPAVGAIVAWDDAVGARGTGVVDVAVLSHDLRKVERVHTFAPPPAAGVPPVETSASDPRLAPRPGGYWLTWVARRPEHPVAPLPLPAGEVETPSEEATFGWLEAVALDADGAAMGSPTRLTSDTGHVGAYATAAREGALFAVAVDEGAGERGGSLVEVSFRGGAASPDVTRRVRAGVDEEAAPVLALGEGGEGWVAFADVHGGVELEPVGAHAGGGTTREPLLERGFILGATRAGLAVAVSGEGRWAVRSMACAR